MPSLLKESDQKQGGSSNFGTFCSHIEAGKKKPQLSLANIQGTPTSFGGNGSKIITRLGKKATSKPTTRSLQLV
jgi:hypothetical protein